MTGNHRIPSLDLSRLQGLDVSASNYRTEHEFYIDVFFRHRWFHLNKKKDTHSLVQTWNAFIANILTVGRQSWLDKLDAARSKFEQKSHVGARYKLHRLSREAGLPCLSWGDKCLSCVDNSDCAPKEAYLLNQPYWRAHISSEMREGIDHLQSLYDRGDRSYDDGPPPTKGVSRRTARRDRPHPS